MIPLDTERRGCSVMVVTDTVGSDAMFRVLATCVAATRDHPEIDGLILATSRPGGAVENDDVHRWLEASDQCAAGGLELIEWFVIGKWGPDCPRVVRRTRTVGRLMAGSTPIVRPRSRFERGVRPG